MISVVVPAYNAEDTVEETIGLLLKQSFKDYEVIAVNDGSKDRTKEILEKIAENNKRLRVINQANKGPAAARNLGARKARGDIVLFTDSDCFAPKDLLKNINNYFKKENIKALGGTYRTKNDEKLVARWTGYEIAYRYSRIGKFTAAHGSYCLAVDRKLFLGLGGFNESFKTASGEDTEFTYKLAEKGHKVRLAKDVFVRHLHDDSLVHYLKTQFKRGKWRMLLYKKFPARVKGDEYTGKWLISSILVHALLPVSLILGFLVNNYLPALVFLALSLASHSRFALWTIKKSGNVFDFMILFFVFTRNYAWLLGALKGLPYLWRS